MVIRKVPKRLRLRLSILFEVLTCRDFGDVIVRGVYLSLSLSIEILNSLSLFVLERKVRKSRDVEEYNVQMPKTRAQNQNLYTIYVL